MIKTAKLTSLLFILVFPILPFSCARKLSSVFDGNDCVKRTDISRSVFKSEQHHFHFKDFPNDSITLTYLGCGGFSISRNERIILIDPFFSNPNFLFKASSLVKMKTKTKMVDYGMAKIPGFSKNKVAAILVSHSHYDHLMDVPYVYENYADANGTTIYCSQSSKNMINEVGELKKDNIIALNYKTSSIHDIGESFLLADGTIRITPVLSEHAPHYKGIKMYKGDAKPKHKYTESLDRTRAGWWKEGETYAFLIDFLAPTGDIEFRIYIQSSAANPQNGWLHPQIKDQHAVNLAILGIASFGYVNHYPESLIDHLKPQKLILCHWEDFFKKYDRTTPKRVRFTKVHEAIRRVDLVYPYLKNQEEQFILPHPGVSVTCSN